MFERILRFGDLVTEINLTKMYHEDIF